MANLDKTAHCILRATLAAGLSLAVAAISFGYGHEGHQAIGELARQQLSPQARAEVVSILGNDALANVATWLDDVRAAGRHQGPLAHDPATLDFIRRFPRSKEWHFVNFPVGSSAYDPSSPFATENDVVHGIALSVATLEGKETGLTKAEALKALVHLVGDLHQPLHTVTGYYDVTNPNTPRLLSVSEAMPDSPEDAGGNGLFYTKSHELHALWDTGLLEKFSPGKSYQSLATTCAKEFKNIGSVASRAGDYHEWAVQWATESIEIGTKAYDGIELGAASVSPGRGHAVKLHKISIRLPSGYESSEAAIDARQVALAGARLAGLLNSLHWAR